MKKWIIKVLHRLWFGSGRPHIYIVLLKEAARCEEEGRRLQHTDPYMAGVHAGRSEILHAWASHPSARERVRREDFKHWYLSNQL